MAVGTTVASEASPAIGQLLDPKRKWYNNRRLITLHAWVVLFVIISSANGFDGSLMNSFQSLWQWEGYFKTPNGSLLGVLSAMQNIGSLAAYPFAPYLSDGIGRRMTIFVGSAIILVGVGIQSAATNMGMFIGGRFLIGFGVCFAGQSAPLLVTEISYPPYRAPLTSVYNSLWYSGNVIASWTTYGTAYIPNEWSWRIPSIIQGIPSLLQFILIFFAPESPRWLIAKGKEAEGLKILAYYHADGNDQDPLVQFEFEEIRAAIAFDRQVNKKVGWKALFATPGNRRRMTIAIAIGWFSQWTGNGLVSYYLNKVFDTIGITSTTTQLLITGILAIWNLVISIGASFLVDRAGRRPLFLWATGGSLVFFTLQTICSAQYALHGNPAAAHAVIAFIFLFYGFYDLAFTPLIITYTVEILPNSLRAKGLTVYSVAVSLGLIFNQYVNPVALSRLAWKYYIFYCCWIAFEFVFLYFMLIETKNRTLEETAALFDNKDIAQAVVAPMEVEEVRQDDKSYASEKAVERVVEDIPA
ncbi:general substrate transporter [Laetiporus sulphureus 93-53]|uniref:General substrate transporter n=1 Tax=Laetiporus sulphureus 93-53 TaxID=1314785 RepID=A0A165F2B5_9APHY|nr:general substrate transporter [Laetiporus sulphureus 93-53]KZT08225.1 general substrate transporter [Laetiporus sulphureus 93-53]